MEGSTPPILTWYMAIETPSGRFLCMYSRKISAVVPVISLTCISRMCVRISYWTRCFLKMCADFSTVNFCIRVGRANLHQNDHDQSEVMTSMLSPSPSTDVYVQGLSCSDDEPTVTFQDPVISTLYLEAGCGKITYKKTNKKTGSQPK